MLPPKRVAFISAPSYPFTTHPACQPLFLQSLAQFTARHTTSSTSSFFPLPAQLPSHPNRASPRLHCASPRSGFGHLRHYTPQPHQRFHLPAIPTPFSGPNHLSSTHSELYLQLHVRKSQFKHTHPNPIQPNHYTCTFSFGNPQGVDNCDNSIENIECPDDWTKKTRFRRE